MSTVPRSDVQTGRLGPVLMGAVFHYVRQVVNGPGLATPVGQALAAGVEKTGVTVHYVDEGVDTGPPIVQHEVPVPPGGDRAQLEAAIHAVEHRLYPEAIRMIAEGRVRIDPSDPGAVVIDD